MAVWRAGWRGEGEELRVGEPTADEVRAVAPRLAAFYNEPHNRRLLANTVELAANDVADFHAQVNAGGGRTLLLWRGDQLMGDADFRHVDPSAGTAEFAILIGERAAQGKGLGTRFATMAHALAFATMPLGRVYVSIVAGNVGSLRLFGKLGYRHDDSPAARAGVDDATDVTLSVTADAFRAARAADLANISFDRP